MGPAATLYYTLSLHDALPISLSEFRLAKLLAALQRIDPRVRSVAAEYWYFVETERGLEPSERATLERSEEHTSELQSPCNLVCRLLLAKNNKHAWIVLVGRVT